MTKRLRVFQVASGNVGTEMVKRIVKHPDLQLVGLHCYSPDKIGRDAGDIVGIGPIGVTATGTIDDILAARPDCLTFHGVWPDMELYERVLEAGINVVTTADWVTGHHRDTNHRRGGARGVRGAAGGMPARQLDVLRHGHESRAGADPHDRAFRRCRRHRERHLHRVGRRVLPPLRRDMGQLRLRPTGRRSRGAAASRAGHQGVRGRRAADGRLPRHRARRGRPSIRTRRLHQGCRPRLVQPACRVAGRLRVLSTSARSTAPPASSCTSSGR